MASESVSSYPDWANLLSHILTFIAKRLSVLDYARFSAVCTSWASIASQENGMPRPLSLRKNQPYLLFSGDGVGNCEQSDFCTLFDFQDNSVHVMDPLPEIRDNWIISSQFGWLTVIDKFANPSLLNPFTRSQIKLPPISTHPNVRPVYDSEGSLTGYDFHGEYCTVEESQEVLVFQKLVLSSNPTDGEFGAVAIDTVDMLIYMLPGHREWTLWIYHRQPAISDVICHDGKFLAVSHFGDVYVVDLSWPYYSLEDSLLAKSYGDYCSTSYLVDSSGLLLHVLRRAYTLEEDESRHQTYEIEIRSLHSESGTWSPVTSLGDRSLFVGSWCSVSLSAKEISWLKENCVYFVDDNWDLIPMSQKMVRDIGVFNLSDGTFETFCPPDMKLTWPPPVWITSPQILIKQHRE